MIIHERYVTIGPHLATLRAYSRPPPGPPASLSSLLVEEVEEK